MKTRDIMAEIIDGKYSVAVRINETEATSIYYGTNIDDAKLRLSQQLEKSVAEEYGLKSYYEWKPWLLSFQAEYNNNDYRDNWLFPDTEDTNRETLSTLDAFGETWYIVRTTRRHKICGKAFDAYEVFSDKKCNCCEALCGFRF